MTDQNKDKITKIIKALLAKAAGTDNENEADVGSERRVRQKQQPKESP